MKLPIRSQSASLKLTTKSVDRPFEADYGIVSLGSFQAEADARPFETDARPFNVIYADFEKSAEAKAFDGQPSFDDLIAEAEASETDRIELAKARAWVGETFYKAEADSLRALRLKAGLSQSKLAGLVKSTQSHIARIESGAVDPQIGTVQRIANALGVDMITAVRAAVKAREIPSNK